MAKSSPTSAKPIGGGGSVVRFGLRPSPGGKGGGAGKGGGGGGGRGGGVKEDKTRSLFFFGGEGRVVLWVPHFVEGTCLLGNC